LRNALARLHRVRLRAEIVQADLDFAAVIAVDDTDTVRDMNALFDAETAASENEARRTRGELRRNIDPVRLQQTLQRYLTINTRKRSKKEVAE